VTTPAASDRRPELPTGVVTFLFSDIEGSTRLLQALGDGYPALLERQAAIVRAAIAAGDGVEIGTEGDSFFAVFATPAGAVRAAVAIQRGLAAVAWPEDSSVRVRIGLHTGDGRRGGDDYVGLDVHRAARIAAAAHGGQVLISAETEALTGRGLPSDGVDLRDVGHHRLKDLDRVEHLYQLVIDGLPADFPPIRSLDAGRSNLPEPMTTFVGREAQLDDVVGLVGEHRLVTLTGPGGTGKTRLAIGAADRLRPGFVDGVCFVALDLVQEASLVPSLVAGALGVAETRERTPTEALTEHLRAAARPRQRRTDPRRRAVHRRPAEDRTEGQGAGHEPSAAPPLRGAAVFRPTAPPSRLVRSPTIRRVTGGRGGGAVRGPRPDRAAGLRADRRRAPHDRGDRDPPRRSAACDRAGRRSDQGAVDGRPPDPARTPARRPLIGE
jgi:class 3 adenylate cyclase